MRDFIIFLLGAGALAAFEVGAVVWSRRRRAADTMHSSSSRRPPSGVNSRAPIRESVVVKKGS